MGSRGRGSFVRELCGNFIVVYTIINTYTYIDIYIYIHICMYMYVYGHNQTVKRQVNLNNYSSVGETLRDKERRRRRRRRRGRVQGEATKTELVVVHKCILTVYEDACSRRLTE